MSHKHIAIIDNSEDSLSLREVLKDYLKDTDFHTIKIATGYWDLPGLSLICDELSAFLSREGTTFQLLVGTDPVVRASQLKEGVIENGHFPGDYILRDIRDLSVKEEYRRVIDLLLAYLGKKSDNAKVQICLCKQDADGNAQFLHAKCYIFSGSSSVGIIGSSNLTQKGLEDNAELNYLESNPQNVTAEVKPGNPCKGHIQWFDEKWAIATDWSAELRVELGHQKEEKYPQQPPQVQPLTPYELYIRYLQDQFNDVVDDSYDNLIRSYLPAVYDSYQFQIDAVKQCYSIMKRYGGFLLGDVVGLGKTVVGTLIIRRFIDEAAVLGRPARVLLITPPAIRKGWEDTIRDFDLNRVAQIQPYVDFVTTGKIQSVSDDIDAADDLFQDSADTDIKLDSKQYGLILIDESHGFRNDQTKKYRALNTLIGKTVPTPYIGLLSATPQNNSPKDLRNQLCLFIREPKHCPLAKVPGGDMIKFFAEMERQFDEQRNNTDAAVQAQAIARLSEAIRDVVLNDLVVRRTRSDIKANYPEDSRNLHFPTIVGPNRIDYTMDDQLAQLFADTMDCICPMDDLGQMLPVTSSNIGFYRYAAIAYLIDPADRKLYEKHNLTVESITHDLEKMMRIMLVKRLESSFSAFKESLEHLLQNTRIMVEMLDHNQVFVCPDLDINAEFRDKDDPNTLLPFDIAAGNIRTKMARRGGNNREFVAADFAPQYRDDLLRDIALIENLCRRWDKNNLDPKYDTFKQVLSSRLFDASINNPHGYDKPRLVIFTEALATQNDIARYAKSKGHRVLTISAKNRDEMSSVIAANFDANYKDEQRDDYDILVTTEVLAEGVNLHRANVILNYDAPWNSTRLMQRIGRVNRIGSKEDKVYVFNFFPTGQGNATIHLVEKAYAKLQSFHILFGEDSKIFSQAEQVIQVDLSHALDGDTSPFCEYIKELRSFRQAHPADYQRLLTVEWGETIGGQINANCGTLVAYTDQQTQGVLPIYNPDVCAADSRWKVISSLETMEYLHCTPDAVFCKDILLSEDVKKAAQNVYVQHCNKRYGAANNRTRLALEALREIQQFCTPADRDLIGKISQIIRNGNISAANAICRFNDMRKSGTLFDNSMEAVDFSQWLHTTFDHMTRTTVTNRGPASVAFWENK